jgi:hypothetical protein
LQWTFVGPAGSRASVPFACDFEVQVTGASLVDGTLDLTFPPGDEWSSCEVGIRAR